MGASFRDRLARHNKLCAWTLMLLVPLDWKHHSLDVWTPHSVYRLSGLCRRARCEKMAVSLVLADLRPSWRIWAVLVFSRLDVEEGSKGLRYGETTFGTGWDFEFSWGASPSQSGSTPDQITLVARLFLQQLASNMRRTHVSWHHSIVCRLCYLHVESVNNINQ